MGINKLVHQLSELLAPESRKKKKFKKRLKKLLSDLRTKEKRLEKKMQSTKNERKHDRLQKEMNIVHAERETALQALSDAIHEKDKEA